MCFLPYFEIYTYNHTHIYIYKIVRTDTDMSFCIVRSRFYIQCLIPFSMTPSIRKAWFGGPDVVLENFPISNCEAVHGKRGMIIMLIDLHLHLEPSLFLD